MEERLRYLFRQYLDNTCSYNELEEFFAFVKRAENDETLRDCIRKVYLDMRVPPSAATHVDEKGRLVLTEPPWLPAMQNMVTEKKSGWMAKVSLAALVIVMAGAIWFIREKTLHTGSQNAFSVTKKSTDRSESKFLLLEDSTQVWLNAASSIEYPDQFNATKREVFLTGEAFFDVMHADKIPFIIHTGDVSTTVLGTAFNIKAYPGSKNITVSVSRGKVQVSRKDGWTTTLTVGQQVKLEEEKKNVHEKSIPTSDVAAWQQGTIVYDDETLEDIIADLQRVYNVSISIEDPALHSQKISTSFKKEIGIEQALHVLCRLTETELKIGKGSYVLR
jgi:transmembrane sensor